MKATIATRIFEPEPAAASFRLAALASAFAESGWGVSILTTAPVRSLRGVSEEYDSRQEFRVSRWPVFRDKTGYVRGYLQYMSFDLLLFFRILFGRKADVLVIEPPPTSWLLGALAARIRRIPYFLFAADIWSDASESTGAPKLVVRAVRWMESRALRRSRGVFAVNMGVADRIGEISPSAVTQEIGNGVDTEIFSPYGDTASENVYALYSGTASEWQGAGIFVRAAAELVNGGTDLEIVFLGQGTAIPELKELAHELSVGVQFIDTVPPREAAAWMRGAKMSLSSIRPGSGYDFAFPTKIFAAWACGTPVVYAGPGPARAVIEEMPELGESVEYETHAVAEAMQLLLNANTEHTRSQITNWAVENVSLRVVASRAVSFVHRRLALNPSAGAPREH